MSHSDPNGLPMFCCELCCNPFVDRILEYVGHPVSNAPVWQSLCQRFISLLITFSHFSINFGFAK